MRTRSPNRPLDSTRQHWHELGENQSIGRYDSTSLVVAWEGLTRVGIHSAADPLVTARRTVSPEWPTRLTVIRLASLRALGFVLHLLSSRCHPGPDPLRYRHASSCNGARS